MVQSPAQLRAIYGIDAARNFMTNHAVEVVFPRKSRTSPMSYRSALATTRLRRAAAANQRLAMRSSSETVSEHRRALMLPQELKLLPKSKAFILA